MIENDVPVTEYREPNEPVETYMVTWETPIRKLVAFQADTEVCAYTMTKQDARKFAKLLLDITGDE